MSVSTFLVMLPFSTRQIWIFLEFVAAKFMAFLLYYVDKTFPRSWYVSLTNTQKFSIMSSSPKLGNVKETFPESYRVNTVYAEGCVSAGLGLEHWNAYRLHSLGSRCIYMTLWNTVHRVTALEIRDTVGSLSRSLRLTANYSRVEFQPEAYKDRIVSLPQMSVIPGFITPAAAILELQILERTFLCAYKACKNDALSCLPAPCAKSFRRGLFSSGTLEFCMRCYWFSRPYEAVRISLYCTEQASRAPELLQLQNSQGLSLPWKMPMLFLGNSGSKGAACFIQGRWSTVAS